MYYLQKTLALLLVFLLWGAPIQMLYADETTLQVISGDWEESSDLLTVEDPYGPVVALLNHNIADQNLRIETDMTMHDWKYWENGFTIFDYQGPNNFKYAGAFVNSRWAIGQYDGSWRDYARVTDKSFEKNASYHLGLEIRGSHVQLFVNNELKVEHIFPAFQTNKVGLAGDRASLTFSHPQITALHATEPSDRLVPLSGVWSEFSGEFSVAYERPALALLSHIQAYDNSEISAVMQSHEWRSWENGFIVFDYRGPQDFKYAGARINDNRWVIGHYDGYYRYNAVLNEEIFAERDYTLRVEIRDSQEVRLFVNDQEKLVYTYEDIMESAVLGLSADRAMTTFKNVQSRNISTFTAKDYTGKTQSGLDQIIDVIRFDPGLQYNVQKGKVSSEDIAAGADAANSMNRIILEAIQATGVANDGVLSTPDARDINSYIHDHYYDQWIVFHGDDEDGEETGFHRVQNDGASGRLFGHNAVNTVADGLYHLGFQSHGNRVLNEDGNRNASFENLSKWLDALLDADLQTDRFFNASFPEIYGVTGTGLDQVIDIVKKDAGLQKNVSTSDMREAMNAANSMNTLIVEAIRATGVADDGILNSVDAIKVHEYIHTNHYDAWVLYHGDDENNGEETGYHTVQNDGSTTRIFGENALNTVVDGLYHLGFESYDKSRVLNEDGNRNATFEDLGNWLYWTLEADLKNGTLTDFPIQPSLQIIYGDWSESQNVYDVVTRTTAVALLKDKEASTDSRISVNIKSAEWRDWENGFIIFDYKSPIDFKYAGARVGANQWVIGHYDGTWKIDRLIRETINTETDYQIQVAIQGQFVTLFADGGEKVRYRFSQALTSSKVGIAAERAATTFSQFQVENFAPIEEESIQEETVQEESVIDQNVTETEEEVSPNSDETTVESETASTEESEVDPALETSQETPETPVAEEDHLNTSLENETENQGDEVSTPVEETPTAETSTPATEEPTSETEAESTTDNFEITEGAESTEVTSPSEQVSAPAATQSNEDRVRELLGNDERAVKMFQEFLNIFMKYLNSEDISELPVNPVNTEVLPAVEESSETDIEVNTEESSPTQEESVQEETTAQEVETLSPEVPVNPVNTEVLPAVEESSETDTEVNTEESSPTQEESVQEETTTQEGVSVPPSVENTPSEDTKTSSEEVTVSE